MKNEPTLKSRIIRKHQVMELIGCSKSTLYNRVKDGLWPTPISLGARRVGFVLFECETVLSAMIAGKTSEQIKQLVQSLIEQRKMKL